MSAIKTPLNERQYVRLINVVDFDEPPLETYFIELEGTYVHKICAKFNDRIEDLFLPEDDYDFVKNGLTITRGN